MNWLSVEDAAARLNVGKKWLANQARADLVPHRRLGRSIRFTEADLQAIEESAARGAAPANPWRLAPRSASRRKAS